MFLDIFTTILGVIYLLLEYRASIYLWYVGMLMPALDIMLYWNHGLYGDAGMAVYYLLAAVYGWYFWKFGKQKTIKGDFPISHMPLRTYLPAFAFFLLAWWGTYELLVHFTNSDVPVLDAFTNALSFVGLWALSRKYVEQWAFWLIVDAICCYLYVVKGIPFKAGLYGLYTVIAVAGYCKWWKMAARQ